MQIFFGRLVAWLAGSTLTIWTAYRAFWVTAFLSFLALILYTLFLDAVQDIMNAFMSVADEKGIVNGSVAGQFTGLAGWLMIQFKVPECIVFAIDIIMLKWTLRKIPFIKW